MKTGLDTKLSTINWNFKRVYGLQVGLISVYQTGSQFHTEYQHDWFKHLLQDHSTQHTQSIGKKFSIYHPLHWSFLFRTSLSVSIGDLQPSFSWKITKLTPRCDKSKDRYLVITWIKANKQVIYSLVQKDEPNGVTTCISGLSTRINGFVSSSSSSVEGIVGRSAWRCWRAHANFCCIFSLFGSTVKANSKFFTVYWGEMNSRLLRF